MSATLNDIVQELTAKTQQGKIPWRPATHGRQFRTTIGEFRIKVEYQDWDEKDYYQVTLEDAEEQVIESTKSEPGMATGPGPLFLAAAESTFGLAQQRDDLWTLIQELPDRPA